MAVTTAAVVGIATGVASTAKSFSDAAKAKKAQDDANKEAARLMSDARKRAETNYFEGLQIPLDAYEKAFETTLTADRQMVEALQEGEHLPRQLHELSAHRRAEDRGDGDRPAIRLAGPRHHRHSRRKPRQRECLSRVALIRR